MNHANHCFIYALLLNIVLPIHGVFTLQDATNLKKSFTDSTHKFLDCLKGDKDCSQGEIIASRIGLALVAAITGGTIIYMVRHRMPSQPAQETKTQTTVTPISPEQKELNKRFIYSHDIHELQSLLDAGADINAQDGVGGPNALTQAVRYNSLERVQFLLDRSANVNITSFNGETPLMTAAYDGKESIVKALLTKNPMINMKDNDGHTALHDAAYKDNITIVQDLLKAGADPNIKNKRNDSPLDTAYNKPAIEALLKKYGAKLGKELP